LLKSGGSTSSSVSSSGDSGAGVDRFTGGVLSPDDVGDDTFAFRVVTSRSLFLLPCCSLSLSSLDAGRPMAGDPASSSKRKATFWLVRPAAAQAPLFFAATFSPETITRPYSAAWKEPNDCSEDSSESTGLKSSFR
jgi:hypothetical protein